jgi:hypothetical protein
MRVLDTRAVAVVISSGIIAATSVAGLVFLWRVRRRMQAVRNREPDADGAARDAGRQRGITLWRRVDGGPGLDQLPGGPDGE